MKRLIGLTVALILFSSANILAMHKPMQKPVFDINQFDEPARQAFARLIEADVFAIGPVGFAARTSETETAFRTLLADAHAIDAFHQLIADAKPEGQAYGLLGLYVKDRNGFKQEVARVRDAAPEKRVQVMSGCVIMPEGMNKLIGKFAFYAANLSSSKNRRVDR